MLVEKEVTGSTNDDARDLALQGAPEGTVVLARRQTKGRGRAGRMWSSPEGGLYVSVLLRPTLPPHRWPILSLAMGAAVIEKLRAMGHPVDLKWPNDVLLAGRKAGGILVESRAGAAPFVVVGLGLNVSGAPEGEAQAAGLHRLATAEERRRLAVELADAMTAQLRRVEAGGLPEVLEQVRAQCVTLGKLVEWEEGVGVAVGVADDGALLVERDGGIHRVVAGDVRVRQGERP